MKKLIIATIAVLIVLIGAAIFLSRYDERTETYSEDPDALKTTPAPSSGTTIPEESKIVDSSSAEKKQNARNTEIVEQELNAAFQELPSAEELKNLDEHEVHLTPDVVKNGGAVVGSMIDKAQQEPGRREETMQFLLRCAEARDLVPAVRAVCWRNILDNIPHWDVFVPVTEAQVPEDIKSLAMKLR